MVRLIVMLSAAAMFLPGLAQAQAPAPSAVPQVAAPPDHPVPAAPLPNATGITPQGMMGVTPTPAPATAPMRVESISAATPAGSAGTVIQVAPGLRAVRRASLLIGASVHGAGDSAIGTVEDIILPHHGGVPVAVLSVGGFLGIGARLVAVPADRLSRSDQQWRLADATKESLAALPAFAFGD